MEARARSRVRRLHSLSGVVPVGGFLVFHLAGNVSAARGADAYNETARRLQQLPLVALAEILLIALPLFFHALYGLFLTAAHPTGDPGLSAGRRRLAVFQRATGILAFFFILFHLWTTRLVQVRDHESLDLFHLMQALLASPWIRSTYVVGLLAATAHFSAGLWSFADGWGLARTRRARIAAAAVAGAVFASLSGLGFVSLWSFRL